MIYSILVVVCVLALGFLGAGVVIGIHRHCAAEKQRRGYDWLAALTRELAGKR